MNDVINTTNRTQVIYKDISPYYKNKSNIGYDSDENEDAILNSLRNLFLISMGQVPGKPWLGNPINVNLFENISPFIERSIEKAFINTITNFEPRVEIERVIVQNMTNQPNTVDVELRYYNLIEDKNLLKNYRFSINYNSITNLTLREPI
jgi:phage baseplate assembly protein W